MRTRSFILALFIAAAANAAWAGEIGFSEDFALAPDRSVPLKQLIPGTEDYYYYHCLHFQNTEQYDKVEETLAAWIQRYKYTARVQEIINRQALLTFEKNPERALARIRTSANCSTKNRTCPPRSTQTRSAARHSPSGHWRSTRTYKDSRRPPSIG